MSPMFSRRKVAIALLEKKLLKKMCRQVKKCHVGYIDTSLLKKSEII